MGGDMVALAKLTARRQSRNHDHANVFNSPVRDNREEKKTTDHLVFGIQLYTESKARNPQVHPGKERAGVAMAL
jgi:hypothetical protein